jgi:hypothetical protein
MRVAPQQRLNKCRSRAACTGARTLSSMTLPALPPDQSDQL